nr:scavenger receptor class F member 1-like [Crassostrea gigas]
MAKERTISVFLFVIKVFLIMFHCNIFADGKCVGSTFQPCCTDYIWNEEMGKCVRCMAGFYGVNCTKTCRYPSYGTDCQQKCYCAEYQCHVIIGCVDIGSGKMTVEFPTSNFLLGCIVCLLLVLVIFKVIKLIPSYRGYFEIRQKLNRQSTQRRYDSIHFDVRSPTDTVLQNSLEEQERNDDSV